MADIWGDFLVEAAYDGVRIDVTNITSRLGNVLVSHAFPRRGGAEIDDQGTNQGAHSMGVIFYETIDRDPAVDGNHIDRFKAFKELCHDGRSHRFTHPFLGEFLVKCSEFTMQADANNRDSIGVNITFLEEEELQAVFTLGAGAQRLGGVSLVNVAADQADADLAAAGLTSTAPGAATDLVESWDERGNDLSAREVELELASFNNNFQTELDRIDVAMDVDNYPAVRSMVLLNYNMLKAADAFKQTTPRLIELTVVNPLPLRVLAALTYGGDEADNRTAEMQELNDIRRPGLLPAGTVLKASSPNGSTRTRSPRAAA